MTETAHRTPAAKQLVRELLQLGLVTVDEADRSLHGAANNRHSSSPMPLAAPLTMTTCSVDRISRFLSHRSGRRKLRPSRAGKGPRFHAMLRALSVGHYSVIEVGQGGQTPRRVRC